MNTSKNHGFSLTESGIANPVCLGCIECTGSDGYNVKAGKILRYFVAKPLVNEGDIKQFAHKGCNHDQV